MGVGVVLCPAVPSCRLVGSICRTNGYICLGNCGEEVRERGDPELVTWAAFFSKVQLIERVDSIIRTGTNYV